MPTQHIPTPPFLLPPALPATHPTATITLTHSCRLYIETTTKRWPRVHFRNICAIHQSSRLGQSQLSQHDYLQKKILLKPHAALLENYFLETCRDTEMNRDRRRDGHDGQRRVCVCQGAWLQREHVLDAAFCHPHLANAPRFDSALSVWEGLSGATKLEAPEFAPVVSPTNLVVQLANWRCGPIGGPY